jgi:hypothetical protein
MLFNLIEIYILGLKARNKKFRRSQLYSISELVLPDKLTKNYP